MASSIAVMDRWGNSFDLKYTFFQLCVCMQVCVCVCVCVCVLVNEGTVTLCDMCRNVVCGALSNVMKT